MLLQGWGQGNKRRREAAFRRSREPSRIPLEIAEEASLQRPAVFACAVHLGITTKAAG
jgi:hypothetical protein